MDVEPPGQLDQAVQEPAVAADGYRALLEAEPEPFVRPGAPRESRLMYLLAGVYVARAMPPEAPLPTVDVELVERWICAGAEDD